MSDKEIVLHLISKTIFFKNYVEFLNKTDDLSRHWFILTHTSRNFMDFPEYKQIHVLDLCSVHFLDVETHKKINSLAKKAKIIINHAFFRKDYLIYSILHPRISKKTIWIVWGRDIVTPATFKIRQNEIKNNYFRKFLSLSYFYVIHHVKKSIIHKMKYVVARDSEYEVIKKSFSKNIQQLRVAALYTSPKLLYVPPLTISKQKSKYNVLLGHSAYPYENHLMWIDILSKFKDNIQLYLILSYGDVNYGTKVEKHALEVFGNSVTLIKEMMDYNDYQDFISTMDVGILGANGQSGLGCIFSLLRCGKKVYLHPDSINRKVATDKGYVTYSTGDIAQSSFEDFVQLPEDVVMNNVSIDDKKKNYEQAIKDWKYIFDEIPKLL